MVLFLGIGPPFVNRRVCPFWSALGFTQGGGIVTVVSVYPAPLGVVPVGLGDGVGDCHDVANFPEKCLFISLVFHFGGEIFTPFSG